MLRHSLRRACSTRRVSPFMSSLSADHISAEAVDSAEQQVSVLLDELTRERVLVKSLRQENETLRGTITTVEQREAELRELDRQIKDQQRTIETYKTRAAEQEMRLNENRIEFSDYKKLVELEKVKLNQARTLPIVLAAVGGAAATYLLVRGTIQFEKENSKFLKFELDQMWHSRVRDMQAALEESNAEVDTLKRSLDAVRTSTNSDLLVLDSVVLVSGYIIHHLADMQVMKKQRSSSSMDPGRVVMSLKAQAVPVSFFTDLWETSLRPVVRTALSGDVESVIGKREVLYRNVEKLVKIQFSHNLFEKLEIEFNEFCRSLLLPGMSLTDLVAKFEIFSRSLDLIVKLFNALDRELIYRSSSGRSEGLAKNLHSMGFTAWRKFFIEQNLSAVLVDGLLVLIEQYRLRHLSDTMLIAQLVNMLKKVELYGPAFEQKYLQATKALYADKADTFLQTNGQSLRLYVEFAKSVFQFEDQFCQAVNLPPSTWKTEDSEILRPELVIQRLPALIQADLVNLVRVSDIAGLGAAFELAASVNEKIIVESVFRFAFQESLVRISQEAVMGSPDLAVVDRLIALRATMLGIIREALGNRASFTAAFKDAMEGVLNSAVCAGIPALLAEWADTKFLAMIDASGASAEWLPDMVGLFKLMAAKDLFEVHYRAFLAKRLLLISGNFATLGHLVNVETAAVNLLKQECGGGYTGKLESMIRDLTVSEELGCETVNGLEVKVCVITTGVWPNSIAPWAERPKLPQLVHDAEVAFMRTYMDKNTKKSIKFVHAMTSAVVRHKRRDLVCSAAQAVVLALFNETDSVGKAVLVAETGIPEPDLSKAVSALLEQGLLVAEDDIISVNSDFKPAVATGRVVLNEYQFRRPAGAPSLTDEERAQTESSVMEDRQHQLDASIVRIMKRVKKATPASLAAEIMEATRFQFSKLEINTRVASLVDREFLEKDAGEDGEIRYLA